MPVNINQITTANTFQQWLVATQDLIGVANNLTNGIGGTFYANTNMVIGGDLEVTGNLVGDLTVANLVVNGTITGNGATDLIGQTIAFAIALG